MPSFLDPLREHSILGKHQVHSKVSVPLRPAFVELIATPSTFSSLFTDSLEKLGSFAQIPVYILLLLFFLTLNYS